eukprot:Hpha_TRINITY_DN8886_c0_g1::TRINITY_DN8886_c0_g1_i2::g.141556::m.141556
MSERFLRSKILRVWRRRDGGAGEAEPPTHGPIGVWAYPASVDLAGGLLGVPVRFGDWCAYQVVEEGRELYFEQRLRVAPPGMSNLRSRAKLVPGSRSSEWIADFQTGRLRVLRDERCIAQGTVVTRFRSHQGQVFQVTAKYADESQRTEMDKFERKELLGHLSSTLRKRGREPGQTSQLNFDGFAAIGSYVTWQDTAKPVGSSSAELMQRIQKSKKLRKEGGRAGRGGGGGPAAGAAIVDR